MEPLELPARLLGKIAWNVPELELLVGMGALALAHLNHYRDAYLFSLDRLVQRLDAADEQHLLKAAATTDVRPADTARSPGWASPAPPGTPPQAPPHARRDPPDPAAGTHILTATGQVAATPPAPDSREDRVPAGLDRAAITAAALSVARDPRPCSAAAFPTAGRPPGCATGCASALSSATTALS
jgi:hypothetical protein